MKTVENFFETTEAFRLGIVPIGVTRHDYGRILSVLSPEEQERAKRKFRKVWRKMARKSRLSGAIPQDFGQKATPPTRRQKQARKELVKANLVRRAMAMAKETLGGGNG